MALTLYEAAKIARNPLAAGLFKAFVTEDELFSILPFVPKEGDSFMYNREKSLPDVSWVSPTHSSLNESTAKFEEIMVPKREIASNFDIYNFVLANQDDGGVSQAGVQFEKKARAAARELASKFITGGYATGHSLGSSSDPFAAVTDVDVGPHIDSDRYGPGEIEYDHGGTRWRFRAPGDRTFGDWVEASSDGTYTLKSDNPSKYIRVTLDVSAATGSGRTSIEFSSSTNEPEGLERLVSPSQVRESSGNDGDALDFGILDELIDTVKERDNLAFVMNGKLRRKYKELLRGLGGTNPEHVVMPGFGADGSDSQRRVIAYEGIPILKNDNIPSDESKGSNDDLSSIYLVNLADDKGCYAGAFGGAQMQVDADPLERVVLGLQIVPVGQLEDKNAQRWRLTWYGAFALGSDLSAARASEIQTS